MINNSMFSRPSIRFCDQPELIENYEKAIADKTQTWVCHHRLEEFVSKQWLIDHNDYYNVSPNELIFLTKAEHNKIHAKCKGYEEMKEKCRKASSGKNNPMYGTHRKWWNNGKENVLSETCPEGFVPGRLGNGKKNREIKNGF